MLVTFDEVMLLSSRKGVSKAGNAYCSVQLFDSLNSDVYDLAFFGAAADKFDGMEPKKAYTGLTFELQPARNGIRLNPAW